jgi:hypothetical protein
MVSIIRFTMTREKLASQDNVIVLPSKLETTSQARFLKEELNKYLKTFDFIIDKHKSLQHIFEIMFPEFLRKLELR